jgi:hypothetical protein
MTTASKAIPQVITDLAIAISHAEGFGVPGAVPTRAHNPGDLKIPGWTGLKTGNEGITVFGSDDEGWQALYTQLLRIKNNQSHVYTLKLSFSQFAFHWTDTQEGDWLDNVLYKLRVIGYEDVDKDTTLGEYFEGYV